MLQSITRRVRSYYYLKYGFLTSVMVPSGLTVNVPRLARMLVVHPGDAVSRQIQQARDAPNIAAACTPSSVTTACESSASHIIDIDALNVPSSALCASWMVRAMVSADALLEVRLLISLMIDIVGPFMREQQRDCCQLWLVMSKFYRLVAYLVWRYQTSMCL